MSKIHNFPIFRTDLEITIKFDKAGRRLFIVRDPVSQNIIELSEEDRFICKKFDGKTSLPEIQLTFKIQFNVELKDERVNALVDKIDKLGFFLKDPPESLSILNFFLFSSPETWKRWNLFNPNKLVHWLAARFWWCYTKLFIIASTILFISAILVIYRNYSAFLEDLSILFIPLSFMEVIVVHYLCVNLPSPLLQGMTSARYGSNTDEFGISLAFGIMPIFYCKNRLWEVEKKSDRGWIIFTNIFYGILVSSLGALCWTITPKGSGLHVFGLTLVVVGVINLAVRLNILWPVDASYLLSNWLEIPDFRNRSISIAKNWIFRRPSKELLTQGDTLLFKCYGLLAGGVTLISVGAGMYFISDLLLHYQWGIDLAVFLIVILITVYYKEFSGWFWQLKIAQLIFKKYDNPIAGKKALNKLLLIGLILFVLFPYRSGAGGKFRIQPIVQQGIRAQVEGQVESVFVNEGDHVKEGDLIALLSRRDIEKDLNVTRAALNEANANLEGDRLKLNYSQQESYRASQLYAKEQISTQDYENKRRQLDLDKQSLQAQTAEVQRLEALAAYYEKSLVLTEIRSPIEGYIATPYMDKKLNHMLKVGDLLATVENSRSVIAEIDLPEYYIGEIKIGMRVEIKTWAYSGHGFTGKVVDIAPIAVDSDDAELQRSSVKQDQGTVRVLNAQQEEIIRVMAELPNLNNLLKPGMTGFAKIEGRWLPFGIVLTKGLVRFFRVEVWSWLP